MEHEIQYARSSGVAIAYEVVSNGEVDLVFVPDYVSNLVYGWEWPRWRDFPGTWRLYAATEATDRPAA